jgi:hypothetical protein
MSSFWHSNWQIKFPKSQIEVSFDKKPNQIKKRRTDLLCEKYVVEFQHSPMKYKEASERKHDYKLHNKDILWIIDANSLVIVTNISDERTFLEFKEDWMCQSFIEEAFIIIDCGEICYKINPLFVKSRMIEVGSYILKDDLVNIIKTESFGELLHTKHACVYKQTKCYIKQQGAGNGKTFGIVQLINDEKFNYYDTFVYLTKQHSAKHIIKSELESQTQQGLLPFIKFNNYELFNNKQHIFEFQNIKTQKECKLIIGTFDSFIYQLGDKDIRGVNKFIAMVNSIINEEIKCLKDGLVSYAKGVRLNKNMLLIGDEMQDLQDDYMKALIKIGRDKYVDIYAVGDKLQSISIEKNAFTFLENKLPDEIEVIRYKDTNICRRFIKNECISFVNHMIDFEKYNLPHVVGYKQEEEEEDDNKNKGLVIFSGSTIYSKDEDEDKTQIEVDKIMEFYIYEVTSNNRKPNDFLIVTPFVNKNPLLEHVHNAIRDFWIDFYKCDGYTQYSVFHKSENGSAIDLSESDNATRIVSIHSSKGDGRPVVFVIGVTSKALEVFSEKNNNLLYDSLLHVVLTRMKETLYFRCEHNSDDIHKKCFKFQSSTRDLKPPSLNISNKVQPYNIVRYNKEEIFQIFNSNIFEKIKLEDIDNEAEKDDKRELIDMKHHCVRYSTFYILCMLQIIENERKHINEEFTIREQPIYQIFRNIIHKDIKYFQNTKTYYSQLYQYKKHITTSKIPILEYRNNKTFSKYSDVLKELIKICKQKLLSYLYGKSIKKFTELEAIVLYHLIQIHENSKFTTLPIQDLYDIIDLFYNSDENTKKLYMESHYRKTNMIQTMFDNLNSKYPDLKFLINHFCEFKGFTKCYKYHEVFKILGYNSDTVLNMSIKPQLNSLNFNETIMNNVLETHLLTFTEDKTNPLESGKLDSNYIKFNDKKQITCILTFDNNNKPYYIDWLDTNNNNVIVTNEALINKVIMKNMINDYEKHNELVYEFYLFNYKQNLNKSNKSNIKNILQLYEENQEKYPYVTFPDYIKEFLLDIKSQVKRKSKDDILEKYANEEFFIKELNTLLEESVSNYVFGFTDSDSD